MQDLQADVRYALNGGPFGSKLVSRMYVDNGVPVIRGANLPMDRRFNCDDFVYVTEEKADELHANLARPGDVVFTQRGTLGQVGLIPADAPFPRFVISQSQMKLTVDEAVADAAFVYYVFRTTDTIQRIVAHESSSGVPHINLDTLRNFEITLPPLDVQRRIAAVLSAYDDLIENNTRRIAILEEMARRLYEEWFVHFRFPGHETTPILDTPQGLLPEGWSDGCLGEFVTLAYGKALKASARIEGPYPVYGSSGVVGTHHEYLVTGPGIVVGRKGNVGSVFWSIEPFYPIDTVFYVQTQLPLAYVFYNLRGQRFLNNDAAVPGLNRNQAYSLRFLVPPPDLLRRFAAIVAPQFRMSRSLDQQNANLRAQRDLLLPKLVSGDIDVSAAEEALPVAAE
ncbi:MAG: restriction endonuclease subunit S [Pseudomonadota bacterium]